MSHSHTRRRAPRHRNVGRLLRFIAQGKKAGRRQAQQDKDLEFMTTFDYRHFARNLQP